MIHIFNITKQILFKTPFYTTLFLFSLLPSAYGVENSKSPDFSLIPITSKIHIIYGPMSQPNKLNRGFRNNPVIIQTSKGVVVIDPGGSAYAGQMVATKVKNVMKSTIVAVFNSHAHGDHWLGNEGIKRVFPQAVIYGHPKMIERVAGNDGVFWLDMINKATNNTSLGKIVVKPDKAVNHDNIIKIGDTRFRIYHTGPAHTDNDIMIEIIEEKAIFMGDVVRNGLLGIMQADSSFIGNIAAIKLILKKKFKFYIPGHGKVGGVEVAKKYLNYLTLIYSSVEKLYLKEIPDYKMKPEILKQVSNYKNWVGFDLRLGSHINRAYLEVEENNF